MKKGLEVPSTFTMPAILSAETILRTVTANRTYCDDHVVALGSPGGTMPASAPAGETGLATDLRSATTTPDYSFITPNLCDDGHDFPCKNQTGGSSALADIDTFLQTWVPKITASVAYRLGGLIEITFDESDGAQSDSKACCNETAGPASPLPGITGPGGGESGPSYSPPSSDLGPDRRRPTTTSRRWRPMRRCSGWASSATPGPPVPRSAPMCSTHRVGDAGHGPFDT